MKADFYCMAALTSAEPKVVTKMRRYLVRLFSTNTSSVPSKIFLLF